MICGKAGEMHLVLQSLNHVYRAVEAIAALAHAKTIMPVAENAYRCENVMHSSDIEKEVAAASFAAGIDYAFTTGRSLKDFKLLAMDMDSTLINIECIDEIADMQGLKPQVAEITEAAMRGELEFSQSLIRRVALLKDLEASALGRVYEERLRLNPGAEKLLAAAKAAGLKTLLVSGGFTFFTDRLKERLALDVTRANTLENIDGILTGKVIGEIVDAGEKRRTVEKACADMGFSTSEAIVFGDGANDLEMMSVAGLSVAYKAKPVVREKADIALNFVGLDGILNILS